MLKRSLTKAFTLLESMLAITVISGIASVGYVGFIEIKAATKATKLEQDIAVINKALRVYEKLIKIDNKSVGHFIAISKIYLDIGKYSKSAEFADKAIMTSESPESYYNRAQIYKSIAESCSGEELSMSDKAVYEMAWEDLKIAIKKGDRRAKKDAAFLEKNYITKNRDWFLNVEDGKKTFKPTDSCYDMIDRKITKRNF